MADHEQSASKLDSASTLLPRAEVIRLPGVGRRSTEPETFTKATVRKMRCHLGQKERFFWDAACRGFPSRR